MGCIGFILILLIYGVCMYFGFCFLGFIGAIIGFVIASAILAMFNAA